MYLNISQLCPHGGSDRVWTRYTDLAARQNKGHVDIRARELASKTSCNIVLKTRQARGSLALQAVGDFFYTKLTVVSQPGRKAGNRCFLCKRSRCITGRFARFYGLSPFVFPPSVSCAWTVSFWLFFFPINESCYLSLSFSYIFPQIFFFYLLFFEMETFIKNVLIK